MYQQGEGTPESFHFIWQSSCLSFSRDTLLRVWTCVSFFQSIETVVPSHVLKNNPPVCAQKAPSVPKPLELDQTESHISDKVRHSWKPFLTAPEDLQIPKIKQCIGGPILHGTPRIPAACSLTSVYLIHFQGVKEVWVCSNSQRENGCLITQKNILDLHL